MMPRSVIPWQFSILIYYQHSTYPTILTYLLSLLIFHSISFCMVLHSGLYCQFCSHFIPLLLSKIYLFLLSWHWLFFIYDSLFFVLCPCHLLNQYFSANEKIFWWWKAKFGRQKIQFYFISLIFRQQNFSIYQRNFFFLQWKKNGQQDDMGTCFVCPSKGFSVFFPPPIFILVWILFCFSLIKGNEIHISMTEEDLHYFFFIKRRKHWSYCPLFCNEY